MSPEAMRSALAQIRSRQSNLEIERVREDADEIRARCQTLLGFVREAWRVLEPRATLVIGWHMEAICKHLEAVTDGRINRLLINVPPGSSKSLLVSVLWPAWEWAMGRTDLRYLNTSYNEIPVKRDSGKMRDLILSEWYQTLFPHVQLTRTGELSFSNSNTGTRIGVPFGSLTSQRGDRLIIDDPHSTETAESDTEREKTTRRFREGALDRLNDLEQSAIVVIMQRLHQTDISGVIETLPELGFVHLVIPMRFEADEKCVVRLGAAPAEGEPDTRPIFWEDPRVEDGELMDPVRFPPAEVDKLEIGKGGYAWAGQYQQRPAPREGGMFLVEEIELVDFAPSTGIKVRGWDIAGSTSSTSPYTAGGQLLYSGGTIYITDMRRKRAEIDKAESLILQTVEIDTRECFQSLPQDPGQAGKSQKRHLSTKMNGYNFKFSPETGSKEVRAQPFASQVNSGNVKMVKGPWNHDLIEELRNFPGSAFKDQVDSLSRAYAELTIHIGDETEVGAPIYGQED